MSLKNRRDDRRAQHAGFEWALDLWMRRKWVALLVFTAVMAAAVSTTVSLPNLYRATATVLVETQHVSEEFVRSSVSAELETRIQTIREEVMSRARLGDLITRFELYPELKRKGLPFDEIIDRMRRDIDLELNSVTPTGRSPTIAFAIKYNGRDPRKVAQVANVLASLYVLENSKIREGQAVRTAEFLKAQLADVKKDLDAREQRVSEFNLSHIGELPQQVAANLASLERLNTQLRLNGDNQVRAMDRRERLEKQLTEAAFAAPMTVPGEPARSPGSEELVKLRQQLDQLTRKYTDQYPEVIRVRAELAELERQLSERPVLLSTAEPSAATAASADPATRLEQGKKVEQFRILDAAIPPRDPSAPSRMRLFAIGFCLALALAIGSVLSLEKIDTSFHSIDDLRNFVAVQTLFSIPLILTTAEKRRQWRRVALTVVSVVIGLALIVSGSRYIARDNETLVRLTSSAR